MHHISKKIKFILILVIIISLGSLLSVFIGFRIISKQPEMIVKAIKDHATLSINNLHQTASRNGLQEWTLDAKSAHLIQAENRSVLEDLSVVFFLENQEKVTLTAQKGVLKTDTNDFHVNGQVVVKSSEYKMETSELRYRHDSRIIFTNVPADITGKSLKFKADKMSFDLNSHKAKLEGNVKGTISGTIGF